MRIGVESRSQRLFRKLSEEGKIKVLSKKATYDLDNKMAIGFNEIKDEFRSKEIESWKAVLKK